jgi:hypothetical protein
MPDWLTILTWTLIATVFACVGVLVYVFASL